MVLEEYGHAWHLRSILPGNFKGKESSGDGLMHKVQQRQRVIV